MTKNAAGQPSLWRVTVSRVNHALVNRNIHAVAEDMPRA
jgi:hypothetical protein